MDILLGSFVKLNIDTLDDKELRDLEQILTQDDEILYRWYFNKIDNLSIPNNRVSRILRKFKL